MDYSNGRKFLKLGLQAQVFQFGSLRHLLAKRSQMSTKCSFFRRHYSPMKKFLLPLFVSTLSLFANPSFGQDQRAIIAAQQAQLEQLSRKLKELETQLKDGTFVVGKAASAVNAQNAQSATKADRATSADRASSAANADSANKIMTDDAARFYIDQGGNAGLMFVFEKDGNFVRYRCSNFGDFGTCTAQKLY
jgi:hypothetical protein